MNDNKLHTELDSLKDDVAKLRADMAELVSALKARGSEKIDKVAEGAEHELDDRLTQLRDLLQGARQSGDKAVEEIESEITQHPFGSVFIAFGIGYLVAKLTKLGGKH